MDLQDDVDFPGSLATKYLQHVEALTEEIRAGMDAMGNNALPLFQQSVSRQQEICTSLSRLNGQMRLEKAMIASDGLVPEAAGESDQALAARILMASASLRELNKRYTALLKHSEESVRLFAGLCRSYTEHFERSAALSTSRPGWSSES